MKKLFQRVLCLGLSAVLALGFCGCGKKDDGVIHVATKAMTEQYPFLWLCPVLTRRDPMKRFGPQNSPSDESLSVIKAEYTGETKLMHKNADANLYVIYEIFCSRQNTIESFA